MRVVVDGPSNLGLRPPEVGAVPGCHKLAGAVRDQGFVRRIGAEDGGCVASAVPVPGLEAGRRCVQCRGDGDVHAEAGGPRPDPGGIDHPQLRALLQPLLASPKCVGIDIGIFDPDLDPDGRYAAGLTDTLVAVLS